MVDSNDLIKVAALGRGNPDALQRFQIQYAENMYNGNVSINRPGQPFNNILEMNAVMTAMLTRDNVSQLSYIYPSLCSTEEELFRHMSGNDFLNVFSSPAKTNFTIGLPFYEVVKNAIDLEDGSGTKKLTIPGQSRITVSDTDFTLQYPIDIFITNFDSITVTYDVSKPSPVYVPSESRLSNTWINYLNNVEYLFFSFDIYQMTVTSQSTTISAIAGFHEEYSYTDLFYFCRCYIKNNNGVWVEVQTTHSDVTYDATIPTVVLTTDRLNKRLSVDIPQIYLNNGLMRDQIRVDIYTTKGDITLTLENFQSKSFSADWVDPNTAGSPKAQAFSGRMGLFSNTLFFVNESVGGGTNGLSFGELRTRVIQRSNYTEGPPVSDRQISNLFKDSGFEKTTVIDNISTRQFLATKALPNPTINTNYVTTTDSLPFAIGGMGSIVQLQSINLAKLSTYATVKDNGSRLTVLPSTLYSVNNGVLNVVDDAYVKQLTNPSLTSIDQLANIVNQNNYYYTPFFYVHDLSGNEYSLRAYRLDNPQVLRKYAVDANNTLGVAISVPEYHSMVKPDFSGWRFLFRLNGSSILQQLSPDQVNLQLSYYEPTSKFRTIFSGTLITPIDSTTGKPVDNEYVFEVTIPTNWDINKLNHIRIGTGTSMVELTADWDVVIFLKNYKPIGAVGSTIDSKFNPALLPDYDFNATYIGVTQEQLTINLGYHIDKIWCRTNSTIEENMYKRYTENIPALYSQTIYETNPDGDPVMVPNAEGDKMVMVVVHKEGDPILDQNGHPEYAHQKGQLVLDPTTKEPIIVEGERGILRHIDMVLLDGRYYFATADSVIDYRNLIVNTLETWNNGILQDISDTLINETKLFFHPKSTVGLVKGYVGDGNLVYLDADQHLTLNFYVPNHVYRNTTLRRNIRITTIQTINNFFASNKTISKSELLESIRDAVGENQLGIEMSGLFKNEYEVVTIAFDSIGPSIGKRLFTDTALNLSIEDSIDIEFKRHYGRNITA